MGHEEGNCATRVHLVILILLASIHLNACGGQGTAKDHEKPMADPVPYKILNDYMGFVITISVAQEIDEQRLRATLAKAADDHQNDAPRDYLMSDHLWVEAYLVIGERQSTKPAGRLGRYVPPRNPDAKDEDPNTVKEDQFFITLEEAKKTLQ